MQGTGLLDVLAREVDLPRVEDLVETDLPYFHLLNTEEHKILEAWGQGQTRL
jgi:hypothetical protein